MSLSQKKPTIELPQFNAPAPTSFGGFGLTAGRQGNAYNITEDPSILADRQAAEQVRRELIGSLGLSGSQSDPYAQTLLQENLRLSQPQLENSLIQRGLGGSSVYQGSITDLISKATTDALLNSQNQKLNTLAGLQSSYFAPYQALGQNLLQLAGGYDQNQQQLAQQMYQSLLPYTAKVNQPGNSGWAGALQGGLTGLLTGGPIGGLIGAGSGYASSYAAPQSTPLYLYQLDQQNKANNALQSLLLGRGQTGRAF